VATTSPLLVAHRAGNELDALRAAERAQVDLIEADLWYWHGRIEVRHTKTMGPLPLLWDRWLLAPGWTPRLQLDEMVSAARPDTELMLDLKGTAPALPALVSETMDRLAPGRRYTVASQSWDLLGMFEGMAHVRVLYSIADERMLERLTVRLGGRRVGGVGIDQRILTPSRLTALRALAPAVFTWTVNDPARFAELAGWGVDGVISDAYARMLPALGRPAPG
jgi:glycerophosphoryl diester phosphodiesterase